MGEITIFDVGHGNCGLVIEEGRAILIDGGRGGSAIRALESFGVSEVHTVVVSHADDDHLGGVLSLLLDPSFKVGQVVLNADATKATVSWECFRRAAKAAQARGTRFTVGVTASTAVDWGPGDISLTILAPSVEMAMGGVGGLDLGGRRITSNSLSVVVLVADRRRALALFTGDIDETGLEDLLEHNPTPEARVLVFPHHGGTPAGGNGGDLASKLCAAVKPVTVLFSIGRGRYGNPKEDVIEGVRRSAPEAYIVCTQLSENCANTLPGAPQPYLSTRYSGGAVTRSCCGGTVTLALEEESCLSAPLRHGHSGFVDRDVRTPLCRRAPPQPLLWVRNDHPADEAHSRGPRAKP